MYYYEGMEIGTFEDAKKYVLADKNRIWSLLGSYLETFEEKDLQYYFLNMVMEEIPIDKASLVGDALTYLSDLWIGGEDRDQAWEDCSSLGDFEYENWEDEE